MSRARNAVIMIFLSLVGVYFGSRRPYAAVQAEATSLKSAVAEASSPRRGRVPPALRIGENNDLRDALAAYPAKALLPGTTSHINSEAPLGSGEGGFKPLPYDPGQDFSPRVLSPSGPN